MSRILSSTNDNLREHLLFYKESLEDVYNSLKEDDKKKLEEYYNKYIDYIDNCLEQDDIDKDTCCYALKASIEYLKIFKDEKKVS